MCQSMVPAPHGVRLCSALASMAATIALESLTGESGRLEPRIHLDVDQGRPLARDAALDEVRDLRKGRCALGVNAQRVRQSNVVDARMDQIHADIEIGLC